MVANRGQSVLSRQIAGVPRAHSGLPSYVYAVGSVVLVLIAVIRIIATYPVFNQTEDEPAHIASGMQWLDQGRYDYELQHPPLARVASALGLYLAGVRSSGNPDMWIEGRTLLYSGHAYDRNLALARTGILQFFVIGSIAVWTWTYRLFGAPSALTATFLFTTLPPVLAHSGLATTDMALAAWLSTAVYFFSLWFDRPTTRLSLIFGASLGIAILSKFSALIFFPACAVCIVLLRRFGAGRAEEPRSAGRAIVRNSLVAALSTLFVVWAGYRFTLVPLAIDEKVTQRLHSVLDMQNPLAEITRSLIHIPLPCGQVIIGLATILYHNASGHPSYLLGQYGTSGWWYFFPIVLAVKTPISFLLAAFAGLASLFWNSRMRKDWRRFVPLGCALTVLGLSMLSRIDLGVRHILVIYSFVSVFAGYGLARMLTSRSLPLLITGIALTIAQLGTIFVHPDYLAYFNILAGRSPESVLSESDLDWGQDLKRLKATTQELGIKEMSLAYAGTADAHRMGLPFFKDMQPYTFTPGWVAISLYHLKVTGARVALEAGRSDTGYAWLDSYKPVALAGKSIRVYYIPAQQPDAENKFIP